MERTGIQVENEKSRPILTAKNICVLVYVLTPNNETGGSGEEPPVSSILESNSAKLRAKNSVLQSKMNNLCQISRQIFRRSFSRNSARYKTFMFLCQVPRLCQIDRLPCHVRPLPCVQLPHDSEQRVAGIRIIREVSFRVDKSLPEIREYGVLEEVSEVPCWIHSLDGTAPHA